MTDRLAKLRAWGPAAGWAAVLFLLSAIPGSTVGSTWPGADKVVHVGLYTVLGVALAFGRTRAGGGVPVVVLVAIGMLYGASDEIHQIFVPGRNADIGDWFADVAGVVLGFGVAEWFGRRRPTGDGQDDDGTRDRADGPSHPNGGGAAGD